MSLLCQKKDIIIQKFDELLKKLGVEAHVQDAMNRPHATDKLKKDGQKLLDRLRRRKNVPEADAKETAHD